MKTQKQTKNTLEYGIELLCWGLVVIHLYRTLAFKVIPGLTLTQSNLVFCGIWIVSLIGGFLLTPKQKRNSLSLFATVNSAACLYFLLSYFRLYRTCIIVALSLTAVVLAAYIGIVVFANMEAFRSGRLQRIMRRFLAGFLHQVRMIVSTGLAVLFLIFYLNLFFGAPLMDPVTVATDPKVNAQKIADNKDTIMLLQEGEWIHLTCRERLEVLQTVANIEATYLGLPHELNVQVLPLNDDVNGYYNDSTHTIAVNPDLLLEGTALELIKTVTHEAYHAYEHRLIDLYESADAQQKNLLLFNRIIEYRHNFSNYISGLDDPDGYAAQAVEKDSVKYSIAAADDYFEYIKEQLSLVVQPA